MKPTDDELEAMATKLDGKVHNMIEAHAQMEDAAAMLRACKGRGRVKPLYLTTILKHAFLSGVVAARNIPAGDPCDGPALWAEYEPYEPGSYTRILAALEPAPDHAEWDAAIEAAIVNLKTYAPHQDDTGPEHDIGYAAGYHTALNRLSALKKGPRHDT